MTHKLETFAEDIKGIIARMVSAESRVKLLERVMKQAVLTNGGPIPVDVNLANAAKNTDKVLALGSGEIALWEKPLE